MKYKCAQKDEDAGTRSKVTRVDSIAIMKAIAI